MQLKYSNYVAFSHDYGFAVNNSGIFIGCRFNLGAINKNGLSRNLTKKIEQIYSGSVVKTKIQAFYNEPISVAELGRCPR